MTQMIRNIGAGFAPGNFLPTFLARRLSSMSGTVDGGASTLVNALSPSYLPASPNHLVGDDIAPGSPLILDLDGDGVEAGAARFFDHGGDGFAELSRWVGADDGMLAWDRNGNGVIDNGAELFGNHMVLANGEKAAHGFAALEELDGNNDGVVDSSDVEWANLRILRWSDGTPNDGDDTKNVLALSSLSAVGVVSLNTTNSVSGDSDVYGNAHHREGSFRKTDGTTADMADVRLDTHVGATLYDAATIPTHSESIAALSDMAGAGRVYDLRDAMALDAAGRLGAVFYGDGRVETRTLEELVSAFSSSLMSGDKVGREELATKILFRWSGAEGALKSDYGGGAAMHVDYRKFAVVEAFMGAQWRGGESDRNPDEAMAAKINGLYAFHYERLYSGLMLQTHMKDLSDAVVLSLKVGAAEGSTDINDYEMDLSGVKAILDGEGNSRASEFLRISSAIYGDASIMTAALRGVSSSWLYEYGYYRDAIYGNTEVTWFDAAAGHVRIDVSDIGGTIKIAPGMDVENVVLSRDRLLSWSQDDLVLIWKNADGVSEASLTVTDYYTDAGGGLESVKFLDGTEWGVAEFTTARIRGTAQDDSLYGVYHPDSVDVFDADVGGNDTLRGYGGDDIYWLGYGTGHDVIQEHHGNTGGDAGDEIRLKSGIEEENVRLLRKGYRGMHLYVQLLGEDGRESDSLLVNNYYTDGSAKVEKLLFTDNTEWGVAEFVLARISGGVGDEDLHGRGDLSDSFDGDGGGNDNLYGYGGDDVYWLGEGTGHDVIYEWFLNSGSVGDEIRLELGIEESSVRLSRSVDGVHLYVQLLGADGSVSDSLAVNKYYTDASAKVKQVLFHDGSLLWDSAALSAASIRGGVGDEDLHGREDLSDSFDGDGGGNDNLYGYGGDDIYWLGYGTGHDVIYEHVDNDGDVGDKIKLKSGIEKGSVRLWYGHNGELLVQLLQENGLVNDSLLVDGYDTDASAKVEKVIFADGTEWDTASLLRVRGDMEDNTLDGGEMSDSFDGDGGGNDILRGKSGNDIYWLGAGTEHDVIREYYNNSVGDGGDEIRIKWGVDKSSVRLLRSDNGRSLVVQLLGTDGSVSDSLKVERYYTDASAKVEKVLFADGTAWDAAVLSLARIRGDMEDNTLLGVDDVVDIFDGDVGGNDILRGKSGNDIYWLGAGTEHDVIQEYKDNEVGDGGDEIRLKQNIEESDVRLSRSDDGRSLVVQLLGSDGSVSDSLTVENYYTDGSAKVEKVVFDDGVEWTAAKFEALWIYGGVGDDDIYGHSVSDIFDGNGGGNDNLYGKSGDDVYWLGYGTGHDVIREYEDNTGGDSGDEIKLKAGIVESDVRLSRSDDRSSLLVQLLENGEVSDSLRVENYYTDASAKVESVLFANGVVWDAAALALAPMRGGAGHDRLYGSSESDIFDGNGGDNDNLYGYGGDDVYWLGAGTGHDVIYEYRGGVGDSGDQIKLKAGIVESGVRLSRGDRGQSLLVQLLKNGEVSDSLRVNGYYTNDTAKVERVVFMDGTEWGAEEFALARIHGRLEDDMLFGLNNFADIFDSDGGGTDNLYGRGGNDVYWLGEGTEHDVIHEYYSNVTGDSGDEIKLKEGIVESDVQLSRSDDGGSLIVQLLENGEVSDSLTVENYYTDVSAKVEKVVFEDGSVLWNAMALDNALILGNAGDNMLYGLDNVSDVFDSDAGKIDDTNSVDHLYGKSGNDVYWLGAGTGHDVIREYEDNTVGDSGDEIKLKEGIVRADVQLSRSDDGRSLIVQLLENGEVSDSLTVENYYTDVSAKVEQVVFKDGAVLWNAMALDNALILGNAGDNMLYGLDNVSDMFDSNAGGNDHLYGYGGDDVYWLGDGTEHDVIHEYESNDGDSGDEIKLKAGIKESDVQLSRSDDGGSLIVQLLENGAVSDSLTVENYYTDVSAKVEKVVFEDNTEWTATQFDVLWIYGGVGDDDIYGHSLSDIFDSNGGGNDNLYGYGGDDVYWLGGGTGHDVIHEYESNDGDSGDEIKLKAGIVEADVRLSRSDDLSSLIVQLLENGEVSDSLRVEDYYTDVSAKVEKVVFMDGTEWDADKLALAPIRGGLGGDRLDGKSDVSDIFDGNGGGNDHLYGKSGDDVYWLGAGTEHDVIYEYEENDDGDSGDKIKLKKDIEAGDVRLSRSNDGYHLYVQLLESDGSVSDSLQVRNYYTDDSAKVETVIFMDGTEWGADKLAMARIRGSLSRDMADRLRPRNDMSDVFDSDGGGNDGLYGYGGDDVYWLGYGTGHDKIYEYYRNDGDAGDEIRLKEGIDKSLVQLSRGDDGDHLYVQLLKNGAVSDSLRVHDYYEDDSAKVETVVFMDGTVWDADKFVLAPIHGRWDRKILFGKSNLSDVFDSNGGDNHMLRGRTGNDIYWLGYDTDHDVIQENKSNDDDGDSGDQIKLKAEIEESNVRLSRSNDGEHLYVRLLENGAVSDSLKVEDYYTDDVAKVEKVVFYDDALLWDAAALDMAPFRGDLGIDFLHGKDNVSDVFDGNGGGNDHLYGRGGDDVYWLGYGTGHDVIYEYVNNDGDTGDQIKLAKGIVESSVRLARSSNGKHLYVRLLKDGAVSDSLQVYNYYTDDGSAKVETVLFDNGEEWDSSDFALLTPEVTVNIFNVSLGRIRGGVDDDDLQGQAEVSDIFDSNGGGNDNLYGRGGNDVYWLGYETDDDVIYEYVDNDGDDGDVIKLGSGIVESSVRLSRGYNGKHLYVELLDLANNVSDSLRVDSYYMDVAAKVEQVLLASGEVLWDAADFAIAPIRGSMYNGSDVVSLGQDNYSDVFDVVENADLYGYGGNDVYLLGYGTGDDSIYEHIDNDGDDGDKIKLKRGIDKSLVQVSRRNSGKDLYIELLKNGEVSDSLTVINYYSDISAKVEQVVLADGEVLWDATALDKLRIRGGAGHDGLHGNSDVSDTFDSNGGGNDNLYGKSGDDVYWLGENTDHDVIHEYYNNDGDDGDEIRLNPGIVKSSVRLVRGNNGKDLYVQLLDVNDAVSDSLRVWNYYTDISARVEKVVFDDGTEWGEAEFMSQQIHGGAGNDNLYGLDNFADIFNSDGGGNDHMRGRGGNDIYWLGKNTDHDVIYEHHQNSGDAGDEIRLNSDIVKSSVRLSRGHSGSLLVELLGDDGTVSDSLRVDKHYTDVSAKVEKVVFDDGTEWGELEFAKAWFRGGAGDDNLIGTASNDNFDGDVGGNDILRGRGGNDIYWLGKNTGHDVINEHEQNSGDAGDEIRLNPGIDDSSVRLSRDNTGSLLVELLDDDGTVSNSLRVDKHYTNASAKVEKVVFDDGTEWGAAEFAKAWYRGGSWNDILRGSASDDNFDGDAGGNDFLYGKSGNDVYWLGKGTGHDVIWEFQSNSGGDAGDKIKLESGIAVSSVRFRRNRSDLYVELLDATGRVSDSLRVGHHYINVVGRVEEVVFADGTVRNTAYFDSLHRHGTAAAETIEGFEDKTDIFDGDAGGDDILRGRSGNDVYWLRNGTGNDVIEEHHNNGVGDSGDKIKIKLSIAVSSVHLRRDEHHLYVELLDAAGEVLDSLRVDNHYTDISGRVEQVVLEDGTVRDIAYFDSLRRHGTAAAETIEGFEDKTDIFDGDAGGDDILRGRSGNDVYWLRNGTGNDVIEEHHNNGVGDSGDEIKIESDIVVSSVRLRRDYYHLYVEILGADKSVSDSLKVENHYTDASGRVEQVVLPNGTVRDTTYLDSLRRHGTAEDDTIEGFENKTDIFDGDAGGDDILRGKSGNDVYWLGDDTGHDVIEEHYDNVGGDSDDVIRIESDIAYSSVRLLRGDTDKHLYVQVLNPTGEVLSSMRVDNYYIDESAKVEKVLFSYGRSWDSSDLSSAPIRGFFGSIFLLGAANVSDVFDGDMGGDHYLAGYSGNDVYWLGAGTGDDIIYEYLGNSGDGDGGDEIRIKSRIGKSSVALSRGNRGADLYVLLLDASGDVSDSLCVKRYYMETSAKVEKVVFADGEEWLLSDLDSARIRGWSGNDILRGRDNAVDVFDGDLGGNDKLYGYGGADIYWLGEDTDHDVIYESGASMNDEIKLKSGVEESDVRFWRSADGSDLYVQLLGEDGAVLDSLMVDKYYLEETAKVEKVSMLGKEWGYSDFISLRIHGGAGIDNLHGVANLSDILDGDLGGNDRLYGYSGNDVYWLGYETDHDEIYEYLFNEGDAGDEIWLDAGIEESDVRLSRIDNGDHLSVQLLDDDGAVSDSLVVKRYYVDESAKVESIHANGKVLLSTQYQALIDEMSVFDAGNSRFSDLDALLGNYWQDEVPLSSGS